MTDIRQLTPPSEAAAHLASEISVMLYQGEGDKAKLRVEDILKTEQGFKLISDVLEYYATVTLMYYSIEMHVDLGLNIPRTAVHGDTPEDELSDAKLAAISLINKYYWHMSRHDLVSARDEFGSLIFGCIDEGPDQGQSLKTLHIVIRDMVRSMTHMINSASSPNPFTASGHVAMLARSTAYYRYLAFITRQALTKGDWCSGCGQQVMSILAFERQSPLDHDENDPRIDLIAAPGRTTVDKE